MAEPARFQGDDLRRPTLGRWDVVTTLADFAIVTYAVDPDVLARHLAPGVSPDVRRLADGREVALISAVPFRDLDFRFSSIPWLRFELGQTNYRAYVLRDGRRAVWFFGTSLTRPLVFVPRLLWRLPWHPARMRFGAQWDGDRCSSYHLRTDAAWGSAQLELEGTDQPMGTLDGFADDEETAVILTHPLAGYYYRRDGRLGSYSIWHDRLPLQRATVRSARFSLFEDLELVPPGTAPHSALVLRRTEFIIRLPPGLVRE